MGKRYMNLQSPGCYMFLVGRVYTHSLLNLGRHCSNHYHILNLNQLIKVYEFFLHRSLKLQCGFELEDVPSCWNSFRIIGSY